MDFGLASEVVLIDINEKKCMGESLDTSHATACISSHNIYIHEGDYEDCKDASMIIITAGLSIKPGETPDDPDVTVDPSEPTDTPETSEPAETDDTPKTGDTMMMPYYAAFGAGISLLAMLLLVRRRLVK